MSRLALALEQIATARRYTLNLLQAVPTDQWWRMPPGGVSHVAWQAGHLAMAEYRLCLDRLRGERPEDRDLISAEFLERFGRGAVPRAVEPPGPTPEELFNVLRRVHEQSLAELAAYPDAELDLPPLKPHPLFATRLGSLLWCVRHEMLHAGQIGLIRRQWGHPPLW